MLRRAGFGASPQESALFRDRPISAVIDYLVDYERQPDDVDSKIGQSAYLGITNSEPGFPFTPYKYIDDARQRWLFRMVHSARPLQERMTLFWHNHFATAYTKLVGSYGRFHATRMLALKPGEDSGRRGQIELFRHYALGKFRDLLIEVAKDPAMLVWLDGQFNTHEAPQENFAREVMELFTFGLGHYTETDVYAAARVFTAWNLVATSDGITTVPYYESVYVPGRHDTSAKTFTFPIYSDGGTTIPARSSSEGRQDAVDFLTALAGHPQTARRLAEKLWTFFVSDVSPPPTAFIDGAAEAYLRNDTDMKPMVRFVLESPWFFDPANYYTRYAWPVEYVARAIKEVGGQGFSALDALGPLLNMGQELFEPPDVAGWALGARWFTSGAMLARMNFAVALAASQRFNLANSASASAAAPEEVLQFMLDRLTSAPFGTERSNELLRYLRASGAWTGAPDQVAVTAPGLARLVVGAAQYQVI